MILYSIILPFISPAARIFAPFMRHFCAMICNSNFAAQHSVKFHQNHNALCAMLVALECGLEKLFFGKEKVKFYGSTYVKLGSNQ